MSSLVIQRGSGVTISGTTNRLAKFAAGGLLADSLLSDGGTNVTLASGQFIVPQGSSGTPGLVVGGGVVGAASISMFGSTIRLFGTGTLSDIGLQGTFGDIVQIRGVFRVGGQTQVTNGLLLGLDTNGPIIINDANHILAQRNGTNAQLSRLYNTFTSSTNFERAGFVWFLNTFFIGTQKGSGGGVARDMVFVTDDIERLRITAAGDIQWGVPLVALGGGAVPTLGTIGGSGPATAAQNSWMRVLDSAGVAFWVPAWK